MSVVWAREFVGQDQSTRGGEGSLELWLEVALHRVPVSSRLV